MRCLYCGQQLKLLKRLAGGDFCSAEHRRLFEGHFSERALNRLLKEEPVGVQASPTATESSPEAASDASQLARPTTPEPAGAKNDDHEAPNAVLAEPSATAPNPAEQSASESAMDPDAEISLRKNPDERPVVSASAESNPLPETLQDRPREITLTRMMVPFIEYAENVPSAVDIADAVKQPSRTNVLVPNEILVKDEPAELADPIAEAPVRAVALAPAPVATSPLKAALLPERALHMDFACQSGMQTQRLVLSTIGLAKLAEQVTAANNLQTVAAEMAVDSSLNSEDPISFCEVEATPETSDPAAEPEQRLDSELTGTEATAETATEANTEAEDDEWLHREWQESTLLPVPLPDGAIQDWRPGTPRCAAFPSRDPEFSISQPVFEAPQPRDIGKVPDLVTEVAPWQGHADPGQSLEIDWQDTPLGKLSTECVAGAAVRLAFPAVGLEGRGEGPLPVRPIGPIGLPQKLTPPPDGQKETTHETAIQVPRKELSRRPSAPLQESENDVDRVEAKLQSLTALARSTQHPSAEPSRPAMPAAEMPDKDEGHAAGLVPPSAVTTPLPVTLLGSAAPRRRATVVFPVGIPATLGPAISTPATVPIREVIYLLDDAPDHGGTETEEDDANESDWAHPDSFPGSSMHFATGEAEAVDEIEPFDTETPSALAEELQAETDEHENQPEVYPQEGPEHV